MKKNVNPICYLCGAEIEERPVSDDHIPPRQFFPSACRKQNLDLFTLPTHEKCNTGYQHDEDYFMKSLGPLASESGEVGKALWDDLKKGLKRPEEAKIAKMISDEFSNRTDAGIILPDNIMYKRFDPIRIWRIVWKITRGLFYKEHKILLPENKPRKFGIIQPTYKTPLEVEQFLTQSPSKGTHPDIFDYKFISTSQFHYWGFCLWQEIIMTILFHPIDCKCKECADSEKNI